jgi:UDP-glucose 4-epimerase
MKILVTGGSGFVGTRLIAALGKGHEIINLDIKEPKADSSAKFVKCDITDYGALKEAAEEHLKGVEVVYHLAALSREAESDKMPEAYSRTNIGGTFNVLDVSRIIGVKKFIFASSFLVYGNPTYTPLDEKHPASPRSIYAATKLCGEVMCNTFQSIYGIKTICLRKSVIYGEDDPQKRIVTILIERAKEGKDLTIYGNKTLDFVYIGDVIPAYVSALGSEETGIFNIGSGVPVTLLELAEMVKEKVNPNINILTEGIRTGEITKFVSDISKARKSLGFSPKQDLRGFIEKYAA